MARNKLMLNNEWESVFCGLPNEQAGELIKAVFAAHSGKEAQLSDPVLAAVFGMMESVIIQNREAYEAKCKKNAENGSKGGMAKASNTKQPVANATERLANLANRKEINRKELNKEKEENKEEKEIRHKRGAFGHVLLSDEQYNGLVERFGEQKTQYGIKRVDEYCEETGKRYKNYALVIQRWGIPTAQQTNKFQNFPQRNSKEHDDMIAKIIAMK